MSADFRFIPHAAQRHAHELTSGRLRDRLAKRGLADARRADEAQDRSGQLVGAGLHGEILDDAVLDLLKPVVIRVEHFLRGNEVLLDLGLLAPWNRQQPVEIVAHDRRLGGHRRHLPQLLQFMRRLLASFLRELGLVDLLFEISKFVAAFVVAELLLDRLHLLVEVVLALGLLHLALDARADLLLDLQHRDLALHQAHHLLKALGDGQRFQNGLAVGDFDSEVRGHGIRELREIRDLLNDAHHFGGNLLVQLHIALEVGHDRTRQSLRLDALGIDVGKGHGFGLIEIGAIGILAGLRALQAFDQHLHGAVGKLQELQHAGERTDLVNCIRSRIVIGRVLLRREENQRIVLHDLFERLDRLLAADEQRHDHVREDDDVAKRQHRIRVAFAVNDDWTRL